jgi:hypothetical protein
MYLGSFETFLFHTHWFSHCRDSACHHHHQLHRITATRYSSAHYHQLHRITATRYSSTYHHQLHRSTATRYSSAYHHPANLRSHPASLGYTQSVS